MGISFNCHISVKVDLYVIPITPILLCVDNTPVSAIILYCANICCHTCTPSADQR